MEDAVLAPIQSAKSADYDGGSGFNAAVKPNERTTSDPQETKPGGATHGMEDPALAPVQEEPKKCKYWAAQRLQPIFSHLTAVSTLPSACRSQLADIAAASAVSLWTRDFCNLCWKSGQD